MNSSPQGGKQLGRQDGAGSGVAHQGGGYKGLHGFMKRISFRAYRAGQTPRPPEGPGVSYAGRGVLDKTVSHSGYMPRAELSTQIVCRKLIGDT